MKRDTSKQLEPIFLIFTKHDGRKVIRTARDAAQVLMKDWPCDDGEEFYDAVKTCLEVILGQCEPDKLRNAILKAASEAGITAITVVG